MTMTKTVVKARNLHI